MLDELLKLVTSNSTESIINNPAVPNEHNEDVINSASSSIIDTVKNLIANGQSDQIAQLASDPSHPAAQMMQSSFIENIVNKFGIQEGAAKAIAGSLIPQVLNKLNIGGGAGGFDLNSLSSTLAKFGLDKNNDSKVDLGDIGKMFGL